MADINPILSAALSFTSLADTTAEAISASRTTQVELANTEAQLQLDIGANNAIIKSVQNNAALATQNARLKAGAITGADLSQQGEVLTDATATFHKAYQIQLKASRDIAAKESVSFLDNPLQHIVNQFTVNDDIKVHNQALKERQLAQSYINQVNQMGDATAKNQANFAQSITQATITADTANTAKIAQIAADKARLQGLGYNIDGLKEAISMDREKLGVLFNVQTVQNQQAQLKIAMDNHALQKQEFNWKLEEKANAAATDEFFVSRIQRGLQIMYGENAPNLAGNPRLAKTYLSLLKSNSPAGKEAVDAYMSGQTGLLGGNAAQVIDSLKSGVAFKFTPQQEPIKTVFDKVVSEVNTRIASGAVAKPTNAAEGSNLLNTEVSKKVADMLRDIKPGDSDNLFNIGAVSAILAMPGVADTALAQKVLAPAVTAGVKFADPKQLYSTTVDALVKKQITIDQAVEGITAVYQKGVKTNLETRQLAKFGIPIPTNMPYNTTIQTAPADLFGRSEIVNLTDKNQVTRALMKTMSNQVRAEMGMQFPAGRF